MIVIGKDEIKAKEIMARIEYNLEVTTPPAPFLVSQFRSILDSFWL